MMKTIAKKLSAAAMIFGLLSSAAFGQTLSHQEKETAKQELTEIYNEISMMSDAEYSKMLLKGADQAREAGEMKEARIFEELAADPASREEISQQIYEKIEKQSENGIFFLLYLATPSHWCYVGDIFCGSYVAILSILTLEGEPASSF